MKIISGGQTGVDRAALDAAMDLGVDVGGWCPNGRKAEDGAIPDKYPLKETLSDEYPVRTELNVCNSDFTLILCSGKMTRGTALTARICERKQKPYMVINLDSKNIFFFNVIAPIIRNGYEEINFAGPRETMRTGIRKKAYEFVRRFLNEY